MSTRKTSIVKDPYVAKHPSHLHQTYVVVPVANIVFVCKSHCIDYLIKELGIGNSIVKHTYSPVTLNKE
jgi:hypothetical protein